MPFSRGIAGFGVTDGGGSKTKIKIGLSVNGAYYGIGINMQPYVGWYANSSDDLNISGTAYLLGAQWDYQHTVKFSTQKVDLCDCNQKKLFTVHGCRIKDANVAVHFCNSNVPKNTTDTGQTCIDQCKPFPAQNLEANVTSTSITVRWEYDTRNSEKSPIIMYQLWYMISGGSQVLKKMTWSDIVNDTGPPTILSYTFQNILKPHTNYSIGIRNHNLFETSIDSKKIAVETESAVPGDSPSSLEESDLKHDEIVVRWKTCALWNGPQIGFEIKTCNKSKCAIHEKYKPIADPTSTWFDQRFSYLKPYTTYIIYVTCKTDKGIGPAANITLTTKQYAPYGAPRSFTGYSINSNKIQLFWKDVKEDLKNGKIQGHKIFYRKEDATLGKMKNIPISDVDPTSHRMKATLDGLSANSLYKIQIAAYTAYQGDGKRSQTIFIQVEGEKMANTEWVDAPSTAIDMKDFVTNSTQVTQRPSPSGYCDIHRPFVSAFVTKEYFIGDCVSAMYKKCDLEKCFMLCCKHGCRSFGHSPSQLYVINSCTVPEKSKKRKMSVGNSFQYFL